MSASRVLEQTLDDILSAIKPSQEDRIARNQIIDELQTIVRSMDIFRGAIVEPFGSFVSGLFTKWGDLDISIELPNGSHISSTAREWKKLMLSYLQLRLIGRYQKLQFISSARVPIVKFESRSISCDVSINNLSGQMKSKFMLWIKGIDERFGNMVLLVKEWAKAQEINNSKSGSFNSYSLTLLVIFHFQTCVPAILPPLKVNDLKGVRADVVRRITETCTANIARWKSNRYRLVNQSSLSELLISFFSKFSDISWKARDHAICPYTGKWEALRSNTRWILQTNAIFIEDPFEQSENAARTVKASLMMKISEAFETSYRRASSTYQTEASLLPGLARPRVLKALGRAPSRAGSSSGNHMRMNRSVAFDAASSSQVQQQFQNMSLQHRGQPRRSPRLFFDS
ncbi:hypothetical protein BT93_J0860 [Corymbia citriodora subsp. variegata]|nr:hypothetical protein BT93_J0860 [Corymbia citriodora subsp. variegata]KAF8010003.1 hypothetical protein BT93_J0860 [Corymbia citriodora subsp. variegata]KAF8010004.1 hypothetical protein BT93_J0860 [Corymbia citriodora subsp. variegata]KAF8010005.1 hypothetical protein BT93_J0860 [Corymbia citriodora subsp. variegata]KAF8010006.1 hypothetical protein BT93_J0860 [Corymbia citriodora subsp. variegata]